MRNSFLITIIVIALADLSARADDIRGRIFDSESREPVSGAVIKIMSQSGKSVGFGTSKTDGSFMINTSVKASKLTIRCMGYAPKDVALPLSDKTIFLSPQETKLKEVVVEAPDIYQRGDTLVFNVGKYATAADNAIIDVIKRLPGVKVEDDGQIMYNGKPINKFYIDGNDFVGDQYGLATNNISKDDVAAVEVMENHQPIKALEDIEFSDQAGINLKLKADARSRWVGVGTAGGGYAPAGARSRVPAQGSIFAMRLARKMQNVFTIKADNTGWNPANEIRDTGYDRMFSQNYDEVLWPDYIAADRINAPLSENHIRDNLSWIANAITSWGSNEVSKRLKLNYMGDRLDYATGTYTDYFSDEIRNFIQNNDLRTQLHSLSGELKTEVNRKSHYLKDIFGIEADWENSRSIITGTMGLSQRVARKRIFAKNDLRLIRKSDERLFSLSSRNAFSWNPSALRVLENGASPFQNLRTTDFRSFTESQYGWFLGFWKLYVEGAIDLNYHHIGSGLEDFDSVFRTSGRYDAFLASAHVTPKAEYKRRGWEMTVSVPLQWNHYGIDGSHEFFSFRPRLWGRRQLTAKSDISISASYSSLAPSVGMFVDCAFLTDYRNLYVAIPVKQNTDNASVAGSYRYRNPLTAFFANISASYSYSRSPIMSNQIFIGDFIVSTFKKLPAASHNVAIKGGVSKGFAHSRLVGGVDASVTGFKTSSMRDGKVKPYRQNLMTVSPYFKGSIFRWLSMSYSLDVGFNTMRIGELSKSSSSSMNQKLSFTYMPFDGLDLIIGAEHYLTHFGDGASRDANMVLLDASANWQFASRVRLALTARNLLDRRDYRYTSFGTLSQTDHVFAIRPRNILATLQIRF